ncbi:MAG: hypothetical protein M5U08_19970 [Burkholderiales bacterium]|nr:hypothetical protein [Burkholderiales bacterium]
MLERNRSQRHPARTARSGRDRVERVQQEIQQDLLDLDAVAHGLRQRFAERHRQSDAFVRRRRAGEALELFADFMQGVLGSLGVAAAQEPAQLLDQRDRTPVVGDDVGHRGAQLVEVRHR